MKKVVSLNGCDFTFVDEVYYRNTDVDGLPMKSVKYHTGLTLKQAEALVVFLDSGEHSIISAYKEALLIR